MHHSWIWAHADWPNFNWDNDQLSTLLGQARLIQGKLLGIVAGFNAETESLVSEQMLEDEMITTSAIEGELLNRSSVRSSIAKRLGLENAGINAQPDRYIEGLLDLMLDATDNYKQPFTLARLKAWHAALFPTGYSGIQKINVGELRGTGEMQIVSGRPDKLTIHYIAPPHETLEKEISLFLNWFNKEKEKTDGLIRTAVSHLWFEIIHPFDDGNGRIGRAIVDMALAQDEKLSTRYYSLSSEIMAKRKSYYAILEKTTKGELDITAWIEWFLKRYIGSIEKALKIIDKISMKAHFWQVHIETMLNERQRKALNKLLDAGADEFIGGMSNKKYMHINKTSRATAYRELNDLVEKACLETMSGKGRNSAYQIKWPEKKK